MWSNTTRMTVGRNDSNTFPVRGLGKTLVGALYIGNRACVSACTPCLLLGGDGVECVHVGEVAEFWAMCDILCDGVHVILAMGHLASEAGHVMHACHVTPCM